MHLCIFAIKLRFAFVHILFKHYWIPALLAVFCKIFTHIRIRRDHYQHQIFFCIILYLIIVFDNPF